MRVMGLYLYIPKYYRRDDIHFQAIKCARVNYIIYNTIIYRRVIGINSMLSVHVNTKLKPVQFDFHPDKCVYISIRIHKLQRRDYRAS